ncbi:MAG: hypothetical protein LBH04_07505 [Tannerellaceae bacterium]|jgi:hypothetical protein|nr:hypothetical protein [Tannerellaceae bacterium]
MYIFRFKRRKTKPASEGEVPESEAASVLPPMHESLPEQEEALTPQPEHLTAPEEAPTQQAESTKLHPELFLPMNGEEAEEPKATGNGHGIGDFFKVDIYDIFRYDMEYRGRKAPRNGRQAEYFDMGLEQLELGCFCKVEAARYENGLYDLIFRSRTRVINEEVQSLMAFCLENYGKDFMRKGMLVKADWNDLRLGAFSRFWIDRVRLENIYFHVNLTLYNINANENIHQQK